MVIFGMFAVAPFLLAQLVAAEVEPEPWSADACTSIAVGHGATIEGSGIATHNNDCATCDPRVAFIPAQDYPKGSKRGVAPFRLEYPRYVGADRSETYAPIDGQVDTTPLGYIDQVAHTYAYWEAAYPLVNEHGLGFGESTCGGNLVGQSAFAGGKALFAVSELMKVALERCKSARCAIKTMGDIAVEHGFYGEDPGLPGAGEALSIVDRDETWVFHITGGLENTSATWVAQRVPDDHVAVIGNNFIITDVNCKDATNFMCSPNIFSNAREAKLCEFASEAEFNWLRCYAPDIRVFQYLPTAPPVPYYSTLRVWRIQSLANPEVAKAMPVVSDDPYAYNFSVRVAKKVSRTDVMDWTRDYYQDTIYDMSKGVMAGPHGNPNRLEGGPGARTIIGQFARGISIPRTNYGVVVEAKKTDAKASQSIAWFASDQPMSSVYAPFIASADQAADAYKRGRQEVFSRDSAWWAFNFVANWMNINFEQMMQKHVGPTLAEEQKRIIEGVEALEANWPEDSHVVSEKQKQMQEQLLKSWWTLADDLVVHFSDGVYTRKNTTKAPLGYPAWWLQMIGFNNEFYKIQWNQYAALPPPLLLGDLVRPQFLASTGSAVVQSFDSFLPGMLIGVVLGGVIAIAFLGKTRPVDKSDYFLAQ